MNYIPHKFRNYWKVDFPDRESEYGDVLYVVSEYLFDSLIYEYYRDGIRNHEHSFTAILEDIIFDIVNGHTVSIVGFEEEYSEQELHIINSLINRLQEDIEKK